VGRGRNRSSQRENSKDKSLFTLILMTTSSYGLSRKITRRQLLIGGLAATLCGRRGALAFATAAQPATPVNFEVPKGACDCHTHVFCDPHRFAFWSGRTYTPETATVSETRALHRALRVERIVIVNSLVYGTDNSCMVDALRQLGHRARGIALIDDNTSDTQLDALAHGGVRGIRLNFVDLGVPDPAIVRQRFRAAVKRLDGRDWHIQVYSGLSVVEALQDDVMTAPLPIVFDHFARARASLGVSQTGFDVLVKLVRSGKAYVKISAAYRVSDHAPAYPDVTPLARTLIAANPQRVLWGTDWPHPDSSQVPGRGAFDIAPLLQIDDGRLFNQLPVWAPDENVRRTILVENPARLYGF
jgi:predicted TIM-barrel fold metal-dependent hydrolase